MLVRGFVVSGLALIIGLNKTSLAGLKLKSVDPKPLACWVTPWTVLNVLAFTVVEG